MAKLIKYSAEERQRIISALRATALAQAEFWDTLRAIELDHEVSIETDIYLLNELAGDCDSPPSSTDLDSEYVWASFEEHSSVGAA